MQNRTLMDLTNEVVSNMDERYTLIYVDYRDQLTDTQVAAMVRGDWESLWDSIQDWEADSQYDSAREVVNELAERVLDGWEAEAETDAETEWIDGLREDYEYSEEWDEARFAVYDRDDSNAIRDLASQTGTIYLRVPVGEEMVLSGDVDEDVETVVANLDLPDSPALREVIRGILPEVGEGYVMPFVFGSADVGDLYDLPAEDDARLTLTGGSLLLENTYMGSGWNDDLPGDFVTEVYRRDLRTDEDAPGYSWDDVCGLVRGAWPLSVATVGKCEVAA